MWPHHYPTYRPAPRESPRRNAGVFCNPVPTYFGGRPACPKRTTLYRSASERPLPYFQSLLGTDLLPLLQRCPTDCDNKQVRELLLEALDELEKELFSKLRSFDQLPDRVSDALGYLQARNHAELDFQPERKKFERQSATMSMRGPRAWGPVRCPG